MAEQNFPDNAIYEIDNLHLRENDIQRCRSEPARTGQILPAENHDSPQTDPSHTGGLNPHREAPPRAHGQDGIPPSDARRRPPADHPWRRMTTGRKHLSPEPSRQPHAKI